MKTKSTAKKASKPVAKYPERVEFKDTVKVVKVKERDKRGQRTELLNLVPKSGITVKALAGLAKKAELPVKKFEHMLERLHHYGYVQTR